MTIDSIGSEGCACGDYESDNLIVTVSCRKSGSSPDSSLGTAHLLKYRTKNEDGLKELGGLIERTTYYGCDYVRVEKDDELTI